MREIFFSINKKEKLIFHLIDFKTAYLLQTINDNSNFSEILPNDVTFKNNFDLAVQMPQIVLGDKRHIIDT